MHTPGENRKIQGTAYVQNTSRMSVWVACWGACNGIIGIGWASYSWLGAVRTICRHEEVWVPGKLSYQAPIHNKDISETGFELRPNWKASKDLLPRHGVQCLPRLHSTALPAQVLSQGYQYLETEGGRGTKALTFPTSAQSETKRGNTCFRTPCRTGQGSFESALQLTPFPAQSWFLLLCFTEADS